MRSPLDIGASVDRYVVEGVLGEGGMARVYKVRHRDLGSLHALKILTIHVEGIRDRLLLEGKSQARLRHNNVVSVTDLIEVDGAPGLIMECVDGPDLGKMIGHFEGDFALIDRLGRGIISGVGEAHRLGMVHRDLKPANILIARQGEQPVPKILDFGLVKLLQADDKGSLLTHSGATMGTPAYMAPEQIKNPALVDARADLFSLGVVLYELCCGVRPFLGGDLLAIYNAIASGDFVPPSRLVPELPERMARAIESALVVDPARRVPDCQVLLSLWEGQRASWSPPPPSEQTGAERSWDSLITGAGGGGDREIQPTAAAPPDLTEAAPAAKRGPGGWLVAGAVVTLGIAGGLGFWARDVGRDDAPSPELTARPEAAAPPALVAEPAATPTTETPAAAPTEDLAVVSPPPTERISPARPAPQAAPTDEAMEPTPEPAPEPAEPAPAEPPTIATVSSDESIRIWLVGAAGQFPPGEIPPGRYSIKAFFDPSLPIEAGSFAVEAGEQRVLRCSASMQTCSASAR